jgi:hypothetical protein
MVALELDTNDGHGTIKTEPAPRKRENWIENHEPILNPNQLDENVLPILFNF